MKKEDEYLAANLQRALAVDSRVGVLDITVVVSGNRAHLHGQVPSERRKQAAAQVVKELAPELEVFNHLKVVKLREPAKPELVE